jgi:hypothetical protein
MGTLLGLDSRRAEPADAGDHVVEELMKFRPN